jgi:hypothetical protein
MITENTHIEVGWYMKEMAITSSKLDLAKWDDKC